MRMEAPQAPYKLIEFLTVVTRAEFIPVVGTALSVPLMLHESKQSSCSSPRGFSGIEGIKLVTSRKKGGEKKWGRAVILHTMEQLTYRVQRTTSTQSIFRGKPHIQGLIKEKRHLLILSSRFTLVILSVFSVSIN